MVNNILKIISRCLVICGLWFIIACENSGTHMKESWVGSNNHETRRKSAGTARLRSSQNAPVLAYMDFAAEISNVSGNNPSLLEYVGTAYLTGTLSFKRVVTSTCSGGGYIQSYYSANNTQNCPISANVNYRFTCVSAHIEGRDGGALFACSSAQINGRNYHIYGELRSGVSLDSNYTIEYVEICKGPGVPPTCGKFKNKFRRFLF